MATTTETMNALKTRKEGQVAKKDKKENVKQLIQAMQPQFAKALPSVITPERFTRIALTAVNNNPKLADCALESFFGSLLNAAQLGLEPNTPLGQAYLIPYGNQCQFQIGYKGLIDLAHRSGEFKMIYAKEVYEKDDFSFEYGLDPKLHHVPSTEDERGAITHYYAVYTLVNGGFGFEVMTKAEVEKHARKFSKAYNSGPWRDNFDEMAKKTVIKKLLKYAPIKTDFVKQVGTDEAKMTFDMEHPEEELKQEYVEADFEVTEDGEIVE